MVLLWFTPDGVKMADRAKNNGDRCGTDLSELLNAHEQGPPRRRHQCRWQSFYSFTQPGFTVAQMQQYCIDQLRKQGMPRVMAWAFTRSLPRLQRWRS